MLYEIIMSNVSCFVIFAVGGVAAGFVWKWKPIVAKIGLILFATWFILSIAWVATTPVELGGGFSTDKQWYHFIGALCGGMVWSTMFEIGKNVYAWTEFE